ncbi:MAG: hypothetical protein K2J77_06995 [Oscillospiraceae bacterium]|nr:hypothetical protein [Oscillospiraceae bacterium]
MKSIIAVIIAFFTLLTSGHGGTTGDPVDPTDVPRVMMFTMHNNWAWGIQQSVMVIDSDGNCYLQYTDNSNHDYNYGNMPDGWIDLKEDGWYEKLVEITETGEYINTFTENANLIRNNVGNFESWGKLPVKEYNDGCCDYGVNTLYGVYYAEGGMGLTELACVGDAMECRDSKEVMKFVNGTGLMSMKKFT